MTEDKLSQAVERALEARRPALEGSRDAAVRLFDGFREGWPGLVVDLYAGTLVLYDRDPSVGQAERVAALVASRVPGVRAAIRKARHGRDAAERNGLPLPGFDGAPDRQVVEDGVRYAIELTLNRDASFYLDTRELRRLLKAELGGARVLNAFAYTGSLGVAARAAPAAEVIHLDRTRRFLEVARASYALNGFEVRRRDFRARDFFVEVASLRREGALFDAVIVDPPFFSTDARGTVDLERGMERLLNKVRPLVADGGRIFAVNNGLFVPGASYLAALEGLGRDGYVTLESIVPVPDDVLGPAPTEPVPYPADPAPFSHPTKIAVLRVRRKDGRSSGRA
jgi:23S rRNA (cytosine1962-C5)-methyltransferase